MGVSELEEALVNISVAKEILGNNPADAIRALQEVSQLSKITLQNRTALHTLLASQGGVCAIINTSCCVYVDQSGRISADVADVRKLWEQVKLMHKVKFDSTSAGFHKVWSTKIPGLGSWTK